MLLILTLFMGCSEDELTYECTEEDVLQECDSDGVCTDVEDCAADGMMCNADHGHCMSMDDTSMSDM